MDQQLNLNSPYELSIVLPCLNEAETLAICINKAFNFIHSRKINGEVIVADNGSCDGSPEIARQEGARVIYVASKGYGKALMGGIQAAQGQYIIMGDADNSYDFSALDAFLEQLRAGFDLVMGNRLQGGIQPGAMPVLHRYLGNPLLSGIGKLFFKSPIGDFHCGLRGFKRAAILNLDLCTGGMEFASEMVVKATLHQLRMTEVPIILYPAGRSRVPHLRSWHDGWRHLRFLLMYSPRWLFLYPGLSLISIGLLSMGLLLPGPVVISNITFDIHTLLLSSVTIVLGVQTVTFAILAKQFAINAGLLPNDARFTTFFDKISLEKLLIVSLLFILVGVLGIIYGILTWQTKAFGALIPSQMMRLLIPSVTLISVGFQLTIASFFKSLLNLELYKN